MSWPTKFVFLAHCTTLWKWGHPSCSKLIRLNFTCRHRFASQNTLGGSLSKVSVMTFAVCSAYMECAGSILNSGHFRYQSLGGSLQQCSALILNAGARLLPAPSPPPHPAWLCPTCAPGWTLSSFIPWCKIKSCMHLILTLKSIKPRWILPCFKRIRLWAWLFSLISSYLPLWDSPVLKLLNQ